MISKPDSLHGRHVKQLVIFSYYSDRKGQDHIFGEVFPVQQNAL